MADWLQFLPGALIVLAAPGPTNTVMALAGAGGRRSPVMPVAAELAGYALAIALSDIVLLPLVAAWPAAALLVKLAIIAYLVVAAARLWRTPLTLDARGRTIGARDIFVTTLLNPKGFLIAVALLPLSDPHLGAHAAVFALLIVLTGLAWFWAGSRIATMSRERAVYIPRAGAVALLGFAALIGTAATS